MWRLWARFGHQVARLALGSEFLHLLSALKAQRANPGQWEFAPMAWSYQLGLLVYRQFGPLELQDPVDSNRLKAELGFCLQC